jgi:hypothetical protein
VSTLESRPSDAREAVAGLLAAAALATSLFGLAYKPARLIPVAAILALVATRMTERHTRLAAIAVAAAVVCWTVGMTIAVIAERPLY